MGAWEEIVDYTVPSNTTSVILDNFGTITKDDFIKISFTHTNSSGSGSEISIFPNTTAGVSGHNTTTNYHRQELNGGDTGVGAARVNVNNVTFCPGNQTNYSLIYFKLSENNRANFFNNNFRTLDSSLFTRFFYVTSSGVTFADPITSLTFTSTVTNGLGANSRIQIYKLAAEKVADITVTSNTARVDITGLDIKKGDEYLLVSDVVTVNGDNFPNLMVNGNTTRSNYYSQLIAGNGSTSTAVRFNEAIYLAMNSAGQRALGYSHIKLSNIGAYTSQNYTIKHMGTSDLRVENFFISSTAENITSINQLNIVSLANRNGTGSRFELYKLYEGGN